MNAVPASRFLLRCLIKTLAIHPNGQTIVSGREDKTIKFWRII
ncbi:MAG: WD40 repeat domain-containing protein [Pleurocapsa sp. MO_192.B19]|nr:WD40 repeat domain-containing protein [Pleurocapsa sp. MO_192.B19]